MPATALHRTPTTAVVFLNGAPLEAGQLLGLGAGDAIAIHNEGAVVSDAALESIASAQRRQGVSEIVLVHHPESATSHVAGLQHSLRRIRSSAQLARTRAIRGFVYDAATGEINEVPRAAADRSAA